MTARFRIAPIAGPVIVGTIMGHGGMVKAHRLSRLQRAATGPRKRASGAYEPTPGTWLVFPFYCAAEDGPSVAVRFAGATVDLAEVAT